MVGGRRSVPAASPPRRSHDPDRFGPISSESLLDILIATIHSSEGPFILVMSVVTNATVAATTVAARYLVMRYSRQR